MKYLSFITVLILAATLFSFVLSHLTKDETKHEYGIAFPLEESESRLPPISSLAQAKVDSQDKSSVGVDSEPTTTTETIATSTPTSPAELVESEDANIEAGKESISVSINNLPELSFQNETQSEDSKDEQSENDDSQGSTNPKLIFIERLMGLNFQRPSTGFSPLLEVQDSDNENKTKNESAEEDVSSESNEELPWGNTLENLRSKWESRIRKFTFPFQNTYSVVLRASNVVDSGAATENDDESEPKPSQVKPIETEQSEIQAQNPRIYFQSAAPLSPMAEQANVQPNSQANQLLRMAALSMMSKLFSAIRSQVYTNNKFESSNKLGEGDNHEIDLDDDDDDSDNEEPNTETISVPVIIGNKAKSAFDAPSYGEEQPNTPLRSSIMYGRPSASVAQSRFYQPAPVSPLAAIISAAMTASRQQNYARMEPNVATEPQPQRIILLITQRPNNEPTQPRVQIVARDDQATYQPSAAQPNVVHYSPLSVPSSPILYHYHNPTVNMAAAPVPQAPTRPQVVEVPVPVYVPMLRMHSLRNMGRPFVKPVASPARSMPERFHLGAPASQSPSGQMAIVYYHSPEQDTSSSNVQENSLPMPSADSESSADSEPTGMVRILLRPKAMAAPEAAPVARFAFHRRIDEDEDDHVERNMVPSSPMLEGRLRQWRDYSQSVRSAPTPLSHFFVSSAGRDDQDSSASEGHYPQYQAQNAHNGPIFYSVPSESSETVHPSHQQLAYQQAAHPQMSAAQNPNHSGHSALFILAGPHHSQHESDHLDA